LHTGFVSKLDAAGKFVWATALPETGRAIAADSQGNAYVARESLSRFDPAGRLLWTRRGGAVALDIDVNASGDIVATGGLFRSGDFDPSESVLELTSSGSYDVFVFQWKQPSVRRRVWHNADGVQAPDEPREFG
jgi:hypothetical protein